jgi:hypothetical protein
MRAVVTYARSSTLENDCKLQRKVLNAKTRGRFVCDKHVSGRTYVSSLAGIQETIESGANVILTLKARRFARRLSVQEAGILFTIP